MLGLSLAFILSQDQTLHCKILFPKLKMTNLLCTGIFRDKTFYTIYIIYNVTRFIFPACFLQAPCTTSLLLLHSLKELYSRSTREIGCKITTFSKTDQIFCNFFSLFLHTFQNSLLITLLDQQLFLNRSLTLGDKKKNHLMTQEQLHLFSLQLNLYI